MFISLSLLLILLFVFGFWIVKESNVSVTLKVVSISLFFFFCVIVGIALDSAMGWAAKPRGLPEIVTIRSVVIKEPNPLKNYEGNIYLMLDMPPTKYDSFLLSLFGHKTETIEPKLFKLPYTRELHEQMELNVIPKTQRGQLVQGKITKGKPGKGKGKGGKGNGEGDGEEGDGMEGGPGGQGGRGRNGVGANGGRGGGSESLDPHGYQFYELPPSYFLRKH